MSLKWIVLLTRCRQFRKTKKRTKDFQHVLGVDL